MTGSTTLREDLRSCQRPAGRSNLCRAVGRLRSRGERAQARGNLLVAEATTRELGIMSLNEALELVALIA